MVNYSPGPGEVGPAGHHGVAEASLLQCRPLDHVPHVTKHVRNVITVVCLDETRSEANIEN